jgi:hypothetical protein
MEDLPMLVFYLPIIILEAMFDAQPNKLMTNKIEID